MSGVSISSGGAVEVDADDLRAIATALDAVVMHVGEANAELRRARDHVSRAALAALDENHVAIRSVERLEGAAGAGRDLASALRTSADAYDLIELRIQRAVAASEADAVRLGIEIDRLRARSPAAEGIADAALKEHARAGDEAASQLGLLGVIGLLSGLGAPLAAVAGSFGALAGGVRDSGRGRVERGRGVAGDVGAVPLRQVVDEATTAPTSLRAAMERIPQHGEQRVRVERYEMSEGRPAFAVYVTGMQTFFGDDPWNGEASVRLFTGNDAASLDAVETALTAAGAEPGDALFAFGHSQGGMIVDALAADGRYDVQVLGTAGSPTSYDAGPTTFSAELRHPDDPLGALVDGGHPQRVGAEGSFVAERTVDPGIGVQDLRVVAHHLDAYLETASLVDASGDPRVEALHGRLATLGGAGSVTAYEFAPVAEPPRVPVPAPGPRPVSASGAGAG